MPVAYTTGLSITTGADFKQTLATLGQQKKMMAEQQKAIVDQMKSRQKAADKLLSETEGYDVSKLIPPLRQHFKDYYNQKLQEINNFAIDDPVAARRAVQDIANWFNTYAAHNSDEVQSSRETYNKVATDAASAAKFNDQLPVYMQSAASPQSMIQAQQAFEGTNIVTQMGADGTVMYKSIDPETGEPTGDWSDITSWDAWANPATFTVPTQARYGKSAIQIGEGTVRDSVKAFNKDTWSRDEAYRVARGIVNGGIDNEDSAAARAWAVVNLFTDAMRDNESLVTSYIQGDINNEAYKLNSQYISDINEELVKQMAESSRFIVEEDEAKKTGAEKDADIYRSDFDSRQTFVLDSLEYLRSGELMETDEDGVLVPINNFEMYGGVNGSSYVLSALDKKGETVVIDNPRAGEENRRLSDLNERYDAIKDKSSSEAQSLMRQIDQLTYSLGDMALEPVQFEIQPKEIGFLPNGKVVLMDLSVKKTGSQYDKVKTIILDQQRDREAVQTILQSIRRTYRDPNITLEGLQSGIVFGPQAELENAVNDAVNQVEQATQQGGLFDNYGQEEE
jgi:hypothetical protein